MEPMSKAQRELARQAGLEKFRTGIKGYSLPRKEDLEAAVERNAKCGKCAGEIRAMIERVEASEAFAVDQEMLVRLYCRKASCGWTAAQWRTWVRTRPNEL